MGVTLGGLVKEVWLLKKKKKIYTYNLEIFSIPKKPTHFSRGETGWEKSYKLIMPM